MVFSFLVSKYWRLEARTIRHGGDLWPLHTPEELCDWVIADWAIFQSLNDSIAKSLNSSY
jgi:hypothetical protein